MYDIPRTKAYTHSTCTKCNCRVNISDAKKNCASGGCPVKQFTEIFRTNPAPPKDLFAPERKLVKEIVPYALPPVKTDGTFDQDTYEVFFMNQGGKPAFRAEIPGAPRLFINLPRFLDYSTRAQKNGRIVIEVTDLNVVPMKVMAKGKVSLDGKDIEWSFIDKSATSMARTVTRQDQDGECYEDELDAIEDDYDDDNDDYIDDCNCPECVAARARETDW